jgi:hypothetical protein
MKKRILRLHMKAKYWHEIKAGRKPFEYRLANDYWESRLRGAPYDEVHVLLGYPKNGDESKLIRCKWIDYPRQERLVHPEWENKPVMVYAIDVTQRLEA